MNDQTQIQNNETLDNKVESKEVKTKNGVKKKNTAGMMVFFIVVGALLLGLAYMIFKRITYKPEVEFNAIPSVNVTHVKRGTITKEISVMGNILPTDTYYVVAKVGGDILKVNVENGDEVKKGDPICEIDASKEIEAAYIQYDTARKSFERMQKLYQAGDISLQSFESVKAQYDSYKLQYDTKVEYSIPVAVADGVVENTNMTENTTISQGTVLCYITSEGAKEINFGVTERVLEGIKLNDEVKVEKGGEIYDGYISNISNLIDTKTGLFNVKAVITTENNFASGIMAKVTFPYIKKHNINILPNELVYYEASMPFIYTVGSDNIVTKKYIEVGIENENYSEIITNLDKSLKIVSTWTNDLAEGTLVNIIKDEPVEDEIFIESVASERIKELEESASEEIESEESMIEEEVEELTTETITKEEETTKEIDTTDEITVEEEKEEMVKATVEETTIDETATSESAYEDTTAVETTETTETITAETTTIAETTNVVETTFNYSIVETTSPFSNKTIDENIAKITEVQ